MAGEKVEIRAEWKGGLGFETANERGPTSPPWKLR
jgi:hypothetical protein